MVAFLNYLHLHMKIKYEISIIFWNPMEFGSVYFLCTILLPVTLNCFKINNKIISDENSIFPQNLCCVDKLHFDLPQLYFYLFHFKTNINMKVISLERLVINKQLLN